MFFKRNKKLELFDNPIVAEFEEELASELGVTIYSGQKSIIKNLIRNEIELSQIDASVLLDYYVDQSELLKRFTALAFSNEINIDDGEEYPDGEELLDSEKHETLPAFGPGIGFSITHAIYYHYLSNNLIDKLSEYLKKRRIPFSAKFCSRLVKYYNEVAI
ncbi:hypothetical protein [Flagellimonas myxillae]|uniref:hypothetical protein n=1 Tax=Flagellimonas myxillae TaxID=2942214 RepID=UPI00201F7E1A|nr:hypothetical protein [Muricauda myxillae]MCL6266620.1 hypothetical protein [Muricauda myxillae]